jgi:MoxR-like ATPase
MQAPDLQTPEAGLQPADQGDWERLVPRLPALREQLHKTVIGQEPVISQLLTVLLAHGHALIVGVPGLAKTLLVRTLSGALGWNFNRIQFTPDLMPSDVTGTEILQTDRQTGERSLRFVRGPIFANLILADEINRTPPKTQAALLEAMQEYTVTSGGRTWPLDTPFMVVATQNPIEHEGTYPLPEAQLDRFMFSIDVGYPSRDEEIEIVETTTSRPLEQPSVVFAKEEMERLQNLVRRMPVSRHVLAYAVDLAAASRPKGEKVSDFIRNYVEWGAGPRASQYLILGAKALAMLDGRPAPTCNHVRRVAQAVLGHRVIPNYNATGEGIGSSHIVTHILESVSETDYK